MSSPAPGDRSMVDRLRRRLTTDADPADTRSHVGMTAADGVAVITLDRAEQHNILSLDSWRRLRDVFLELAADEVLRAVVIRGAGEKAFGAGADIKEFPDVRLSPESALAYNEAIATALRAIAALPVPVVAMIGGLAVGGGCELAAACDVRIATTASRFGIPIGRLGVTLGYAEASMLADLIGRPALKFLLLSGRLIDADEALRIGLVQAVVEPRDLVDETVAFVGEVLASSEITVRASKLVVDMTGRQLSASDTELITRIAVEAYGGTDLAEGVAAFAERRRAQFSFSGRNSDVRP